MANVEGVVVSQDEITWTFHPGTSVAGYPGGAELKVRLAGPKMDVTTLTPQEVPSFLTKPTITAPNTTVGVTLGGANGTWKGNPTPTLSRVFWLKNSVVIPDENGGTLATATGFSVGDSIVRGVEIESVINGETVKVTDYSQPFVLTAQQSLLATLVPDPIVAEQDFEILFSAEPDSVSANTTLTQSQLDPLRYTGTAPSNGFLAIAGEKAGWTSYSGSWTYAPVVPVPDMVLVTEPDQTIAIDNVDPDGEPFEVEIAGAVYTIDPAQFGPDQEPVVLAVPEIEGEGGDGLDLTLVSRALFAGDQEAGAITISGAGWHRIGAAISGETMPTYTQDDAVDGDKTLTWQETGTNDAGPAVAVSNGVLCPAPAVEPEGWWDLHPDLVAHVDFAGDRARINGVTYATIAAARSANVIKTSGAGVDYIDVSGLGEAVVLTGKGIAPSTNVNAYMAALDDGDDGEPIDNLIHFGVTMSSGPRASYGVFSGGATTWNPSGTVATGLGASVRMALRAQPGNSGSTNYRGVTNGTATSGTNTNPLPVVTRLCLGNRSPGDRLWTASGGVLQEVKLFNATMTNAEIDALGA